MFDLHKRKSAGKALSAAAMLAGVVLAAGCSGAGKGISAESVAAAAQAVAPKSAAQKAAETQADADFAAEAASYAKLSVRKKAALVEYYVKALTEGDVRWYRANPRNLEGPSFDDVIRASGLLALAPHENLWMPFHGAVVNPDNLQVSLKDSEPRSKGQDGGAVCRQIDTDAQALPGYETHVTCAPLDGHPGYYVVSYTGQFLPQ